LKNIHFTSGFRKYLEKPWLYNLMRDVIGGNKNYCNYVKILNLKPDQKLFDAK